MSEEAVFKDFARFVMIASLLQEGAPLRAVADSTKMAINTIKDTVRRLESHAGVPLVKYKDRNSGENKLTDAGEKLLKQLCALKQPSFLGWQKIRIAAASSLLGGQVLTPIFASYQESSQLRGLTPARFNPLPLLSLQLQVVSAGSWRQVHDSILRDELDLAFVWEIESRSRSDGLHYADLGLEFDVVIVSWGRDCLRDVEPSLKQESLSVDQWRKLTRRRVAVLPSFVQPFHEQLELSTIIASGGELIEVDSFDAAIACVQARVADYAIVPAVYSELERAFQAGMLCFSRAIAKTKIQLVARNEKVILREPFRSFVEYVRSELKKQRFRHQSAAASKPSRIRTDPDLISKLRYGYYVEHDTEDSRPKWNCEKVSFQLQRGPQSSDYMGDDAEEYIFSGEIANQHGAVFKLRATLAPDSFVIRASRVDRRGECNLNDKHSVKRFVSVFTSAWYEDDGNGVIYGTWSGWTEANDSPKPVVSGWTEANDSPKPVVYGTMYSTWKLTETQIQQYCRNAEVSTAMASQYVNYTRSSLDE
jgi:DNA-binding transcriptional LysR family regulator